MHVCIHAHLVLISACNAEASLWHPAQIQTCVLCSLARTKTRKQCCHHCRFPGGNYLQVAAETRSEVAGSLCEAATSGCQRQRPGAALLLVLLQQAGWEWIASQPHASAHNLLLDWAFTGGALDYLHLVFPVAHATAITQTEPIPSFGSHSTVSGFCKRLLQASEPMLSAMDECLLRMRCWLSSSANL